MKADIIYELNNSYLVVPLEGGEPTGDYRVKMLTANHVEGMLPIELRTINGAKQFYLDVSGKENFSLCLHGRRLSREDVKELFESIYFLIKNLAGYLISEKDICFNPEFVFRNQALHTYEFVPILSFPEKNGGECSLLTLLRFVLTNIDAEDEILMNTMLTIVEMYEGKNPKFSLAFDFFIRETRERDEFEETVHEVIPEADFSDYKYIPTLREIAAVAMTIAGFVMISVNLYLRF